MNSDTNQAKEKSSVRWGTEAFGHCSCWEGFNLVGLQTWRVDYCGRAKQHPHLAIHSGFPRLHNELERSTMLFMGKPTISVVIFHSYVKLPEGTLYHPFLIALWSTAVDEDSEFQDRIPRNSTENPGLVESGKAEHRKPRGFHIFIHIYGSVRFHIFPSIQWASNSHPWTDSTKKNDKNEKVQFRWESYPFNLDRNYIIIHSQDRISRKKTHEIASWLSGGTPSPWPHQEQAMISVDRNVRPKIAPLM